MQATLTEFQPKEERGCDQCYVRHDYVTVKGERKVRCGLRGFRDYEANCRLFWPEDPLVDWPPLAPNYETPKKWRQ